MSAHPENALTYLPLGGSGEIGMNLNLYGYDEAWLMVDLGIGFPPADMPGVEVLLPDIRFIEERAAQLQGLVITHAHEDHLGGIPYLWERLRCPVYLSPFAACVLEAKLAERTFAVPIHRLRPGDAVQLGPFAVSFVAMNHSIPEPQAVILKTPAGCVVHSGDWRMDAQDDPPNMDLQRLQALGQDGVLALVCDSTNVLEPSPAISEAEVARALTAQIKALKGRVVVSCFASNIQRVHAICQAAQAADRHVALAGRSLWRMTEAANKAGYLQGLPPILTDDEAMDLPRHQVLLLATGCQGEPRAALARIAEGSHPVVRLEAGDHVLFSSRDIPGNEEAVALVQNRLARQGVHVITADTTPIHTSGHPSAHELQQLYGWLKPSILIPTHGEPRHLQAHAALGEASAIPHVKVVYNGTPVRLSSHGITPLAPIELMVTGVDGHTIAPLNPESLRRRKQLMRAGTVALSLVLDEDNAFLSEVQWTVLGLELDDQEAYELISGQIHALPERVRENNDKLHGTVRRIVLRTLNNLIGKKPVVTIHIHRVVF